VIESYTFTGRTLKPTALKRNPIHWFGNTEEQQLPDWYRPAWSQWRRRLYWYYLRNPLQNFRCYVLGVQDRNYTVTGRAPVPTVQRDDLVPPERGWQWCVLNGGTLRLPLPFVSYCGRHVTWYRGWQPTGFAGAKFVVHKPR
jgi:hypothetical protein